MNERIIFVDQINANQILVISNETQLNHDNKSQKEERERKHWIPQLESWLIFG